MADYKFEWWHGIIALAIFAFILGKVSIPGVQAAFDKETNNCESMGGIWVDPTKVEDWYIDLGITDSKGCMLWGGGCSSQDDPRPISVTKIGTCEEVGSVCLTPDFWEQTCLLKTTHTVTNCNDALQSCFFMLRDNRCTLAYALPAPPRCAGEEWYGELSIFEGYPTCDWTCMDPETCWLLTNNKCVEHNDFATCMAESPCPPLCRSLESCEAQKVPVFGCDI